MRHIKTSAGFTLIEIILVMALIGIMSTAVLTLINPVAQFKKSRDVQRKTDLRQIQSALELYRADQSAYSDTLPACGASLVVVPATYMQKIPCDPITKNAYQYVHTIGSSTYSLVACLENVKDTQKDATNNSTYCTGGNTNWSYTINNP
ncbi:prepilin-type N-terminal cleavage/methylation domain-containing protein [Candidatus Roizmanbacteria bacterium]|nr:prepilin-type N-terminal cleavage/methylation domain-containing protein [Candidatus Roizmanbacteria bacterium]